MVAEGYVVPSTRPAQMRSDGVGRFVLQKGRRCFPAGTAARKWKLSCPNSTF
jgi:hypothetical protein